MTRINCIPVHELSDAHLGAEYRELPRVFRLAYEAYKRGESPLDPRNPTEYTLGQGHVRFFYTRLDYLRSRFYQILDECEARGRTCNHTTVPAFYFEMPIEWRRSWSPRAQDRQLNRERIAHNNARRNT